MNKEQNDYSVVKFDRIRGALHGTALFSKPATITEIETVTGKAETFIVETGRHELKNGSGMFGDTIFVQCVDENGTVTRLALPPRVSNAIASQRDSLTARRRSKASKAVAQARKERGELPGFLRKKRDRK